MTPVKEYSLKLLEVIQETPDVRTFRLEYPKDRAFNFYPGQFMMVSFPNDPEIKYGRAYSIASSPENRKYLEFALDKVAKFTEKMFSLKGGEVLKLKGPYGKFYFDENVRNNLLLAAGGTGITPLIGIIRYSADKKLSNKIKFLYSVKEPELIIYRKELESLKSKNRNFDYSVTITRPEESSEEWGGRTGRIDVDFLKENMENAKEIICFLCGPNEFVKSVIAMLESLGVSKEQIRTDVWG